MMSDRNEGATARDPVAKLDAGIGPRDGGRFSIALRGYDRVEVDECLARIAGAVSSLQAPAPGSRRPEPLTSSAERRTVPSAPAPSSAQPNATVPLAPEHHGRPEVSGQQSGEDGFGVRLEKIMVLARQEAAEIRAGATAEAQQLVEQARAGAAERERELQQQRRQAEAEISELRARVDQEVASTRDRAAQELAQLRNLETEARDRLGQLIHMLAKQMEAMAERSSNPETSTRVPPGPGR
jgi:DivIVA domain-containing protein